MLLDALQLSRSQETTRADLDRVLHDLQSLGEHRVAVETAFATIDDTLHHLNSFEHRMLQVERGVSLQDATMRSMFEQLAAEVRASIAGGAARVDGVGGVRMEAPAVTAGGIRTPLGSRRPAHGSSSITVHAHVP